MMGMNTRGIVQATLLVTLDDKLHGRTRPWRVMAREWLWSEERVDHKGWVIGKMAAWKIAYR